MRTDVRVEGVRENGEEFVGRIAVTPWGIYTANAKIELDFERQLERLRYRVDVRHRGRALTLRCSDRCGRRPERVVAESTREKQRR